MKSDMLTKIPEGKPAGAKTAAETRSEAYRQRLRQAQVIAAQVARARAAGALPSESDAERLIAEFHARGGLVTVCPPPDDPATADAQVSRKGSNRSRSS